MISKTEEYIVEVKRWKCNNPKHRHIKKVNAQKCIDNTPKKHDYKLYNDRRLEICEMRDKGHTFTDISKKFNLSVARVRVIYHVAVKRGVWKKEEA